MASSGNFATLNPLNTRGSSASSQITNGNLQYNGQATQDEVGCTINVGNDGVPKVYFEVYIINNHDTGWLGIYDTKVLTLKYEKAYGTTSYRAMKFNTGQKVTGSTSSNYIGDGSANNSRSGQTVGVAIDVPNGKIWFAINNAWGSDGGGSPTDSNVAFTDLTTTGSYDIVTHMGGASVAQPDWLFNFGADSTMQGRVTAGGNADDNGFGDFRYSPPSGFVALCSANINISDDIDPAQTDDDFPQKLFNTVLYTGNGSTQSITGLGFQPDAVWIKKRSADQVHQLYDSSRGVTKQIYPSQSGAEATYSNTVTSLDSDGFTLGAGDPNNSSATYVAWCWRANGGTTASNTDGSITSTVQANTKAGFSICTYTGNATNGATFGHGLSAKPSFVIIKNRDASQKWAVWHQSAGMTDYKLLFLSESSALTTEGTQRWDVSAISSSVFGLGSHPEINGSSANYVAYLWHDVEGYSKFGSFEGNSNTDGPFIYTGFRPRLVFCKAIDAAENWQVRDTARSTFNADSQVRIYWNSTAAEGAASTASPIDFLSTGFKVRGSNSEINSNTIVYGAWADVPFKYNNTF
jgi:hypothetical protein